MALRIEAKAIKFRRESCFCTLACVVKFPLLICYEVESEELVQQVAKMGADLLIVPTANMIEFDEVQLDVIPRFSKAYELPIVYANAVGLEGQLTYGGLSLVTEHEGLVLLQAGREAGLYLVSV